MSGLSLSDLFGLTQFLARRIYSSGLLNRICYTLVALLFYLLLRTIKMTSLLLGLTDTCQEESFVCIRDAQWLPAGLMLLVQGFELHLSTTPFFRSSRLSCSEELPCSLCAAFTRFYLYLS